MENNTSNLNYFTLDTFELPATARGSLSGMDFVVKDLFAISNHTSSFGNSRWRESHGKSVATAPVISKLLNAGATMVGITKMDQLAYSLVGNVGEGEQPINPLYPDRFTGGSSSGSAAAVAGGVADIGIGTDTGGSVRIPAAACGLYSIRPTHGRIDSAGVIPLANSFDVVGIFTRDANLLLDVFSVLRNEVRSVESVVKINILKDSLKLVESEVASLITQFAQELARRLKVPAEETREAFLTGDYAGDLFARVQAREIWENHGSWVKSNMQSLTKDVQTRLERAEKLSQSSEQEKREDDKLLESYRKQFEQVVRPREITIMPIMKGLPPKRKSSAEDLLQFRQTAFRLSAIASLNGAPEVVVPITSKATGLVYGVGLLGAKDEDETLLEAIKEMGFREEFAVT